MATFKADQVRAVAIELQNKARALYQVSLPVYRASGAWTLNGTDPMLPSPYDVKVQLTAYKSIAVETLRLTEWITTILTAEIDDTLTYPPVPESGLGFFFDETIVFDEHLIF